MTPPEGAVEPSGENQVLKLFPRWNVKNHSFIFFRPRRKWPFIISTNPAATAFSKAGWKADGAVSHWRCLDVPGSSIPYYHGRPLFDSHDGGLCGRIDYACRVMPQIVLSAGWYKTIIIWMQCAFGVMLGSELIWSKLKTSGKALVLTTLAQSLGTFTVVSLAFGIIFAFTKVLLLIHCCQ